MLPIQTYRALSAADALSVSRDTLLRGMVVVPLGLAAAARWLFPPALERMAPLLPFDILPVYGPLFSYTLLLLGPTICGMLVGFLLLDMRDDQTMRALRVTPLPLAGYLAYRLAAPSLLSLAMSVAALALFGGSGLGLGGMLLCALAAAPLAPLTALFLAAFAENKVQGFALQKGLSVLLIAPLLATLMPRPWQLAAYLLPTAWPGATLLAIQQVMPHAWLLAVGGLAYQGLLGALLLRRWLNREGRR